MANRQEITRSQAVTYHRADKSGKSRILDQVCWATEYNRDYARRVLRQMYTPRVVRPRVVRPPKYGPDVVAALEKCWQVLGAPAGKRLAPGLAELVPALRRFGELDIDDTVAALLVTMSAATIDRRLAPVKARYGPRGRSHTKPGTMLKSRIPLRTWSEHDENTPGYLEIDLVGHEGGNNSGTHCFTLTVTDIAVGWTVNRTVMGKTDDVVLAALIHIAAGLPYPVLGIDCDNGSEFINHLFEQHCIAHELKFTRSRAGKSNDGAHVEQKNWTTVRQLVGYLRYDTGAELLLLNKIWEIQSPLANHFYPQQKLISKVRDGARVSKKYDTATTPYARLQAHPEVKALPKRRLRKTHDTINPAALQRQVQALCEQLFTIAHAKAQPTPKPRVEPAARGHSG